MPEWCAAAQAAQKNTNTVLENSIACAAAQAAQKVREYKKQYNLKVRCRPGSSENVLRPLFDGYVVRCRPGSSESTTNSRNENGLVRCRPGSSENCNRTSA